MNTPVVNDVDYIADRITKQARGIIEYGNRCWLNGFTSGFTVACLAPLVTYVSMKVLQHPRIMRL